jgi:hypothetical protein
MAEAAGLTPEQRGLVDRVRGALAGAAGAGWRQVQVEYRAAGRHIEVDVLVTGTDGMPQPIQPPAEVVALLGDLRAGMYQSGRGTWLGVVMIFDPSHEPVIDFSFDVEPRWRRAVPPIGFQDELRTFPRTDQYIPGWLRLRAGLPPMPAGMPREPGEIKNARIHDGLDAAGQPVINRSPLPPDERDRVLSYLDAAPVVLAARGHDHDLFDPERAPAVPLTFRTDGAWVWPGAVAYYLREHDIAPDPELLTHIRASRFTMPEVDEPARKRAVAAVTGEL